VQLCPSGRTSRGRETWLRKKGPLEPHVWQLSAGSDHEREERMITPKGSILQAFEVLENEPGRREAVSRGRTKLERPEERVAEACMKAKGVAAGPCGRCKDSLDVEGSWRKETRATIARGKKRGKSPTAHEKMNRRWLDKGGGEKRHLSATHNIRGEMPIFPGSPIDHTGAAWARAVRNVGRLPISARSGGSCPWGDRLQKRDRGIPTTPTEGRDERWLASQAGLVQSERKRWLHVPGRKKKKSRDLPGSF